jgi:hypothetical protein
MEIARGESGTSAQITSLLNQAALLRSPDSNERAAHVLATAPRPGTLTTPRYLRRALTS